jgi:hypothetical protein
MNINLESILKNDELLIKIFGIFLIVTIAIVPGGLLLFIEKTELFLNLSFSKLLFLSFILSMLFAFNGILMYLSAYILKDIKTTPQLPPKIRIFNSIVSIYIFSLITVGLLYVTVRQDGFFFFFNKWFAGNAKHLYIVNYIFLSMLNVLSISISIVKVTLKENSKRKDK